jgi:hypothetical protein
MKKLLLLLLLLVPVSSFWGGRGGGGMKSKGRAAVATRREEHRCEDESSGECSDQDELFDLDDGEEDDILPATTSSTADPHPLLQISCQLAVSATDSMTFPVLTVCDTGAQRTILTFEAATRCGLVPQVDRRYQGRALGIGKSVKVFGRLPAGAVTLQLYGKNCCSMPSPAMIVLEPGAQQQFDVLLGLDFLREQQAVLDLTQEELLLSGVRVPFVRPRGESSLSYDRSLYGEHTPSSRVKANLVEVEFDDDDEYDSYDGKVDMTGV